MVLPSPNLDDRDFDSLVAEARQVAARIAPQWDTEAPSDPGMMLVEVFAHLTELLLYRVNRIPEKVQVELLRLAGIGLRPPAAARVGLVFQREEKLDQRVVIHQGFPVACNQMDQDGQPILFTTVRTAVLEPGSREIRITALHARDIAGEVVGEGTGLPGQCLQLAQPPVIADSGFDDIQLGIDLGERRPDGEDANTRYHDGRYYQLWEPVPSFAEVGGRAQVFSVDRVSGQIRLAPSAGLAAVPPAGASLRAWYRCGGGRAGNVAAGTVCVPQEPLPGIQMHNPAPAMGGIDAEALEQALERGPMALATLQRAVTARDFEQLACRASAGIERARAFTTAALWPSAQPGTVSLRLVPRPGDSSGQGRWLRADLERHHAQEIRDQVQAYLDNRRPVGTRLDLAWVRYKSVTVRARVRCEPDRNPARVREAMLGALYRTICPIAHDGSQAWPFGRSLHSSLVYGAIMSQPGLSHIDGQVELILEHAPDHDTRALDVDRFKSGTWFAACSERIFRSTDHGAGWDALHQIATGRIRQLLCHPWQPGCLVVLVEEDEHHRLLISRDYGEHWDPNPVADTRFEIEDLAWLPEDEPALLAATDAGLMRVAIGALPIRIRLLETSASDDDRGESLRQEPRRGFYAVAVGRDGLGRCHVCTAAQAGGGVFHSADGGAPGSFRAIGLPSENVRQLAIQATGNQLQCWAGFAALGRSEGQAPRRYNLHNPAAGWQRFPAGWQGGSCTGFAFWNDQVLCGTHHGGVLLLDDTREQTRWQSTLIAAGLPIRDDSSQLAPIRALAAADGQLLIAGPGGLYGSDGQVEELRFQPKARRVHLDQVTLPEHWLFCSGRHEIEVLSEPIA